MVFQSGGGESDKKAKNIYVYVILDQRPKSRLENNLFYPNKNANLTVFIQAITANHVQ